MKVLITGAAGQLGSALQATVPAGLEVTATDNALDITRADAVQTALTTLRPALIINCAAYTRVDDAEREPTLAFAINAEGPANLATAARVLGARLIQISTDYVFDGTQARPYSPGDATSPLGVYGASKLAGEQQVLEIAGDHALVIRTAWLYGASGNNFVKTMLRLMREKNELRVVADQIGTPTWTHTLAQAIWAAAQRPSLHGTYHWTDAGAASWYDFAVAIQEEALAFGLLTRAIPIHPIRTQDYPTPARRPGYSVLDKTKSVADFGVALLHWRVALRHVLKDMPHG